MQKFSNEFLDTLLIECPPHKAARLIRVFGTGKSRTEIAQIIKHHPESIRRYESPAYLGKIPEWYFVVLRFLSGDLSYFGADWDGARICPERKKLFTQYRKHHQFSPRDLNAEFNQMYKFQNIQISELNTTVQKLEKENQALKEDNAKILAELNTALERKKLKVVKELPSNVIQLHR